MSDVREALAEVLQGLGFEDPLEDADTLLASDVVTRIRAEARAEGRVVAVRHESGCSWVTNNSWCDCGLDEAWEAGLKQGRAEVVAAVEVALGEMATWCGPYGHQGVAAFIDRRDDYLRAALGAVEGARDE